MAKELDKVISISGEEYNVNAVHSDSADNVSHVLKLNKITLTDKKESLAVDFDGSAEKALTIVPASGGRFNGRVAIDHDISLNTLQSDPNTVIRYTDITDKIVPKLLNTSVVYNWTGLVLVSTVDYTPAINGISIVSGSKDHLADFVEYNNNIKTLSSYLYICSDSGDVYFGAVNSSEPLQLSTNSLHMPATGIDGQVDIAHGGTGASSAENARANLGITLDNLGAEPTFDVLAVEKGGTGTTTLDAVTVGNAKHADTTNRAETAAKADTASNITGKNSNNKEITVDGSLFVKALATEYQSEKLTPTVNTARQITAHTAQQDSSGRLNFYPSYEGVKIIVSNQDPTTAEFNNTPANGTIWIKYE